METQEASHSKSTEAFCASQGGRTIQDSVKHSFGFTGGSKDDSIKHWFYSFESEKDAKRKPKRVWKKGRETNAENDAKLVKKNAKREEGWGISLSGKTQKLTQDASDGRLRGAKYVSDSKAEISDSGRLTVLLVAGPRNREMNWFNKNSLVCLQAYNSAAVVLSHLQLEHYLSCSKHRRATNFKIVITSQKSLLKLSGFELDIPISFRYRFRYRFVRSDNGYRISFRYRFVRSDKDIQN